jgi:hypothetical protein
MFSGKKTARLWLPRQICVDPFLAAFIRDCAADSRRTIQGQLLHFIEMGLAREALLRKEQSSTTTHTESQVSKLTRGE